MGTGLKNTWAALSGLLFGVGLLWSQMVSPAKVLGFLDVLGRWDPSLALVMVGAIAVGVPVHRLARRQRVSWCGDAMQIPTNTVIDRRLVLGSLTFGMGWGLAGLCPGPALVSAATGNGGAFVFVMAMLAGFVLFEVLERRRGS